MPNNVPFYSDLENSPEKHVEVLVIYLIPTLHILQLNLICAHEQCTHYMHIGCLLLKDKPSHLMLELNSGIVFIRSSSADSHFMDSSFLCINSLMYTITHYREIIAPL